MAYRVLPYRAGSRGANALASALPGGRVLRLQGSQWRPRPTDLIINWGNTNNGDHPVFARRLNLPLFNVLNGDIADLRNVTNKLNFFNMMREDGLGEIIPQYWTRREDIPDEAFPIVCRTVLAGHSGDGIVIADRRADLVAAPLYVQYVKKEFEYRIHVGKERNRDQSIIISTQRKARNRDVPDGEVNWQVRNHANGFVYVRGDVQPPASTLDVARRALLGSGLDFGAVDVIYNRRQERSYVLEINTAPGLEGTTVEDYARFFQNY